MCECSVFHETCQSLEDYLLLHTPYFFKINAPVACGGIHQQVRRKKYGPLPP